MKFQLFLLWALKINGRHSFSLKIYCVAYSLKWTIRKADEAAYPGVMLHSIKQIHVPGNLDENWYHMTFETMTLHTLDLDAGLHLLSCSVEFNDQKFQNSTYINIGKVSLPLLNSRMRQWPADISELVHTAMKW